MEPYGGIAQLPWRTTAGELRPMDDPAVRGFSVRRGQLLAPGWW
ncbi:hypothetical protein [Streptomyces sp. NPDC002104]